MKIIETVIKKLSEKEKRTVKIGAVCAAAILVFFISTKWLGHWGQVRKLLDAEWAKLKVLSPGEAKQRGLLSVVPVFEMPQIEEKQKFLFRDKFDEQLKKAGIRSEPLEFLSTGKSQQDGYRLLRLKCSGKCKFAQILDLLASLKDNPYLVGIEEMRIKCDTKNRQEIELDLTVSTFVK